MSARIRQIVTFGLRGGTWAVELTELTIAEVRRNVFRARDVGRRLELRLRDAAPRYPHLVGRIVLLSADPRMDVRDIEAASIVESLALALLEDRGFAGDGVDFSVGLPETFPTSRGFYGQYGAFMTVVHRADPGAESLVSSTAQVTLRRSEALAALHARIKIKDTKPNEVLWISCGMPDHNGYGCPLDSMLFLILRELAAEVPLISQPPAFLKGVVLHAYPTGDWFEVWRAMDSTMPWDKRN
jgi:hypothetical protein